MTAPVNTSEPQVTIARFKDDRAAALSFTFDDNIVDQATIARPMLERYGFRGTFGVVAGKVPEDGDNGWPVWKEMEQNGHEIANHSLSHPHLNQVPDDDELRREINGAHDIITERIGTAPVCFIYPFHSRDERAQRVVLERHFAVREDVLFYGRKSFETSTANTWVDEAIRDKTWIVPMLHAIESGGYEPFSSRTVLEDHLRYLHSRVADVWVDTFGQITRYVHQRDTARVEVEQESNQLSFTVTCDLNPELFNVPLSVKVQLPTSQPATVTATQNGKPLELKQQGSELLLHVVPSTSPIVVAWTL